MRAKFGVSRSHCVLVVTASLLFSMFLLAQAATAGQESAASIVGQVKDESGATIPGVTVTATSPALQMPQLVTVTNELGEYRLTPLPIGTYAVEYTLSGFQTVRREELRLTVGFVAKVDVVLKIGTLEETVTVSGASPVVDVTSTTTRTELTREVLDLIPSGRNGLTSLLTMTPGVRSNFDVGGSNFNAVPSFHAYGQDAESWQTLEGVLTSSPKSNQSGNQWDFTVLEEARVQAAGADVDVPSRGVALTAILKSGGNDFHGTSWLGGTNDSLQGNNLDSALAAAGLTSGNKLENRWDASGDLGGRIIRDKLWFYGGLRKRQGIDDYAGAFMPDGSPATHLQMFEYATWKNSYQLSQSNRIVGFYQWTGKHEISGASVLNPYESSTDNTYRQHIYKFEWQAVKGNSLSTSLQFGSWDWNSVYITHAPGQVAWNDIVTLKSGGDGLSTGNRPVEKRKHITGRLTWYKPDMFYGNHEFKAGFDVLGSYISRAWVSRDFNYQLKFNNGVPYQIVAFNYPVVPQGNSAYTGLWVKDNWVIARRFTASLGIRFSHDSGYVPEQCRVDAAPVEFGPAQCWPRIDFNTWNTFAPRASFAYDIGGGGKTVVKGGWGRYDHMRQIDELQPANKNIATNSTYTWHDLNGNQDYNTGEVNTSPNSPDFVSVSVRDSGSFANGVMNPNEKEPKADQFDLSLERELMTNLAVRVSALYSYNFNNYLSLNTKRAWTDYNVTLTKPDPGPDGKVGTTDDPGTTITYWEYPTTLAGSAFQVPELSNPPGANQSYKSIEFAAIKRMSKGWQFQASYSATKIHMPITAATANALADYNPNAFINTANNTWEWGLKVSGTYVFPFQIATSAFFNSLSGVPQARTVLFTGGRTIPSIVLNVEPLGSLFLPTTNTLDIRMEKTLTLPKSGKLTVRATIYNATNINTITARTVQSGANYLRPTAFVPPRFFEFGASYNF